jgi:putative tryptophan/tyrosine transport system substrate-binding protein
MTLFFGGGVSVSDEDQSTADQVAAFTSALAQAGWVEGRNVTIEPRFGVGDDSRIRAEADDLIAKSPDLIVCQGSQITAILKQQTRTIPIPVVFVNVGDPVASGFVASFAHPGGNITGFTSTEVSFAGKWLSLLNDITPGLRNVMLLYDPRNRTWEGNLRTLQAGAPTLGVSVWPAPAVDFGEIECHVESFAPQPNAGMIVLPGAAMIVDAEKIAALAVSHRLPAIYALRRFVSSGGLASYGTIPNDNARRAAQYVDRILRGEKAGDLPIQAPTKLEFVLNLKAAKAIGLTVSTQVQLLADEVIE